MNNTAKRILNSRTSFRKGDRYLYIFLFSLLVINAIADSTIYYFIEADQGGGMHPGIIRGILLSLFIALFGLKRVEWNNLNSLIVFFLVYLLVLSFFSSNVRSSILSGYMKWFIPLMMFPVGFYFFRRFSQLIDLVRVFIIGALIVCINLAYAQVARFGISAYVEESFYTGGAGVGITNQLAIVLLTYPLVLRQRARFSPAWRWTIYIVGFFSLVFVLLAMKRAGIISLFFGVAVYLYLTQRKGRFLRYLVVIGLVFYLAFPLFENILTERYNARVSQMKSIENEARYEEFFYVIKEFREGDIVQKMFGKELFNSGETFGRKYFGSGRMIHSDMSAFLYGSGIAGLVMYFAIFGLILWYGVRYRRVLKGELLAREIFPIYYSILFATILISATGSGTIGERSLEFLFMGAILGVSKNYILFLKTKSRRNGSVPADIKK